MKFCTSLLLVALLVASITSCKKKSTSTPAKAADYFLSLQVGKSATYRLDSLNFYFYGQLDTITSYLAKDSVESSYIDASGQTNWLVTRYISDTTGILWSPHQTYIVNADSRNLQMTEDNLRFIKLSSPIIEGSSWNGNVYLPYNPYKDFFQFTFSDGNHLNMNNWVYTYQDVNKPYTAGATGYDSTITVMQENTSTNVPILDPNNFASRTHWSETYAKHIGLVYRHTEIWEYQPPTPDGLQDGYKIGFEVTMTLLSHN